MASTCETVDLLPRALALISDGHRAAVLAHPRWIDVAQEPSAARQLAWMVRQRVLTYDEFDDLQTFDAEQSESDRLVEEAFAELGRPGTIADRGAPDAAGLEHAGQEGAGAGKRAHWQLAFCLAWTAALSWFLVEHWPA